MARDAVIYDALDGTTGRRVWKLAGPGLNPPVHVIASSAEAATSWLAAQLDGPLPAELAVTDRGGADRTEVAIWRDETRL